MSSCTLLRLLPRTSITFSSRSVYSRPVLCQAISLPTACGSLSHARVFTSTMPSKQKNFESNGSIAEDAHQYQAGSTTHRKEDEWKHREPYRIHSNDDFDVKWSGGCHCGKVKYQLSRDKPLASKFCHCTTCQRLHGVSRRTQNGSLY